MGKYTEINYSALKTGDIVDCGGKSPLAYVIRWVTAGRNHRFDPNIASHTGMVVDFSGQKLMIEMKGTRGIQLVSLEKYCENNRRFIIDVRRSKDMNDSHRRWLEKQVAYCLRKNLDYDFSGLLSFVMSKVEDNPKKYYCSEFVYELLKRAGQLDMNRVFFSRNEEERFDKNVSPYDLQQVKSFISIPWEIK